MGTVLKENRNSWLVRVIVVVLALTFIVGLGYTGGIPFGGVASGVAAKVNGEPIPISYYELVRRQIYASETEGLDKVSVEIQDSINRISLSIIIERNLLSQKALSLGLRVADGVVAEVIRNNPSFHLEGGFAGPEYYKRVVTSPRGMGMTVKTFEKSIRDWELVDKLRLLSQASSPLSERELRNRFDVMGAKISVEHISFETYAEAQNALGELFSSGDIGTIAKKFGKKVARTPFVTRLEIPAHLGPDAAEMFAFQSAGLPARKVFSWDGAYHVAALSEREKENPETVRKKIEIAMRDSESVGNDILNNWVRHLYFAADLETNEDLLR